MDLDDVAWVCSMVACGLACEFRELDTQPSLDRAGAQRVRRDGVEGWCCTLASESGATVQVEFWSTPRGNSRSERVDDRW